MHFKAEVSTWIWVMGMTVLGAIIFSVGMNIVSGQINSAERESDIAEFADIVSKVKFVCQGDAENIYPNSAKFSDGVKAVYSNDVVEEPPDKVSTMITRKETSYGKVLCIRYYDDDRPHCEEIYCDVNMTYIGAPTMEETLFSKVRNVFGNQESYMYEMKIEKGKDGIVYVDSEESLPLEGVNLCGNGELDTGEECDANTNNCEDTYGECSKKTCTECKCEVTLDCDLCSGPNDYCVEGSDWMKYCLQDIAECYQNDDSGQSSGTADSTDSQGSGGTGSGDGESDSGTESTDGEAQDGTGSTDGQSDGGTDGSGECDGEDSEASDTQDSNTDNSDSSDTQDSSDDNSDSTDNQDSSDQNPTDVSGECDTSKTYNDPRTIYVARDGSGNYNCDGTNDEEQINQAITQVSSDSAYDAVFLKEGTYEIDGTINLKSNIILTGDTNAKIKLVNNANWLSNVPMLRGESISNVAVRCFEIDGNRDNNRYITNSQVSDYDAKCGKEYYNIMHFVGCSNVEIKDMYLHHNWNDIVKFSRGDNLKFLNNNVRQPGHDIVYGFKATNIWVAHNFMRIYCNSGARCDTCNNFYVYDNDIARDEGAGGNAAIELQGGSPDGGKMNVWDCNNVISNVRCVYDLQDGKSCWTESAPNNPFDGVINTDGCPTD